MNNAFPHSALSTQHSALRLRNGVRAVLLPRPRSPTLALQLFVRVGSRHDGGQPGLAHVVEHLVFRAPGGSRLDLYAAVESLGGEVGGGTTRDYTSFHIVLAAPHAARALALLPALVRPPATDAASFHAEQLVVCQEIRERGGPANMLWDLLLAALWDDDPLVHGPGGTTDSVLTLTPEAAEALHTRWYRAPRLLVMAAGACSADAFAAAIETSLGPLPPGDGEDVVPAAGPPPSSPSVREGWEGPPPTWRGARGGPRALHAATAGPAVHLAAGLAVPGLDHPDGAVLRLLDVVLGHGAASRLPRALAARRLPAPVRSRYVPYRGAGVFAALAACPRDQAGAVAAVLEAELRRLGAEPPVGEELVAAQARYAGAVHRSCESNLGLATAAGAEALFDGDRPPLVRTVTQVAGLSPEELAAVARRYFGDAALARATVGPGPLPDR